MPASHTGEDFAFGLAFSEEVEVGYVTLRDTAFVVTGGEVSQAQRQQQGSNQAWNITVDPDGQGAVTITLPETIDCDAVDAICTGDERPLSHSLSSVVAGPVIIPTVSVFDASAAEGDSVDFTVSLSAASDGEVTVDYATSDGTATAGEDYTATSGTLAFQAGEVTKTISVPTTEDAEDDGGETFTLTLSNASGAGLGDAEATGTIRNTETAAELSADFPESAYTSKRHAGSDDRPQVVVAFSEAVADFDKNTPSVTVTSGLSVQTHTEDGLDNAYVFFMTPDGDGDVTFALVADAACASGGICTAGGTVLTQVPAALAIPGPDDESLPAVSVSDASAAEGDAVAFTVSLSAASSRQVTVEYTTSGGTATSGTDFTAESGTLTFAANATLGDATATGTINDNDVSTTPLTASFSDMPASHTGGEFTFGLAFNENVELSYVTLRDTAFVVTGGAVKTAQRQQQGSNQAWNITVEPSGQGAVTITLPETVAPAASGSASVAESGVVVDDAVALLGGVTPDAVSAALFGEGGLSEAQLDALDRLGNRNGRYDLGDMLSWTERCRRGEARCGGTSTDPASSALLFGAAAAGRRGTSGRPGRRAACPGNRPTGAGVPDRRVDGAGRRARRRRPAGARGSRHRSGAGARSRVVPVRRSRAASDRRGGGPRRGSPLAVPRAGPRPTR